MARRTAAKSKDRKDFQFEAGNVVRKDDACSRTIIELPEVEKIHVLLNGKDDWYDVADMARNDRLCPWLWIHYGKKLTFAGFMDDIEILHVNRSRPGGGDLEIRIKEEGQEGKGEEENEEEAEDEEEEEEEEEEEKGRRKGRRKEKGRRERRRKKRLLPVAPEPLTNSMRAKAGSSVIFP